MEVVKILSEIPRFIGHKKGGDYDPLAYQNILILTAFHLVVSLPAARISSFSVHGRVY